MGSPETAGKADDSCRAKASRRCVLNPNHPSAYPEISTPISVWRLDGSQTFRRDAITWQRPPSPLQSAGVLAKLRGHTS
jgi:hypothetical protein